MTDGTPRLDGYPTRGILCPTRSHTVKEFGPSLSNVSGPEKVPPRPLESGRGVRKIYWGVLVGQEVWSDQHPRRDSRGVVVRGSA